MMIISERAEQKTPEHQGSLEGDILDIVKFNSLPSPVVAETYGGSRHEIDTLDVQTGAMRLNVSGMIDLSHFGNVKTLIDCDGVEHDPDDFWIED